MEPLKYESKTQLISDNERAKTEKKHDKRRKLWYDFLKKLPVTINRQKVIGNYIVDFYCAEAKLAIELDGSQHHEEKGLQSDMNRDAFLKSMDTTVVRYSNLEINRNFNGVCEDIVKRILLK